MVPTQSLSEAQSLRVLGHPGRWGWVPAGSSLSSLGGHPFGGAGQSLGSGLGRNWVQRNWIPPERGVSISADTAQVSQGLSLEWRLSPGMSGPRQVTRPSHSPFPMGG